VTKPLAWFEPARWPPSELAGSLYVDPESTPSPDIRDMQDPFLLHVLKCLNVSAWLQSDEAPEKFQEDLDALFDIFGCTVLNPGSVPVPLYLLFLFADNHQPLLALCSLVYPSEEQAPWKVLSLCQDNKPVPLEPGA
jgi:hypothetical protein